MRASVSLPVLMYHKVGAPVERPADTFLNVPTEAFARQMRFLARRGYRAVTLADAIAGLAGRGPLPGRPLVVTFDDGYRCVEEHAAPVLSALQWPATLYAPSAWVGRANEWNAQTGHPVLPLLDWDSLAALQACGWEIGGHTRSHAHLERLTDDEAFHEVAGGLADLRERLGDRPRTFCYPFGGLAPTTPEQVRRAGFVAACTTKSGLVRSHTDPFLLPRVKVAPRDGLVGLVYRLWIRPHLP